MDISDEQIISEVLASDHDRFGLLVERYWRMALARALTRTSDFDHAKDIAQESFIKAYTQLHKLKDKKRFGGWLLSIVVRKSIDHIRRVAREMTVSLDETMPNEHLVKGPSAAERSMSEQRKSVIHDALMKLPERYRTVVVMRFIGELSTEEIAEKIGKKPGTVRVRLHRAYKMLRDDLTQLRYAEEQL